ncbi:hypothetical protein Hanom_Chr00s131856g01815631 [Helianthus anomalus]
MEVSFILSLSLNHRFFFQSPSKPNPRTKLLCLYLFSQSFFRFEGSDQRLPKIVTHSISFQVWPESDCHRKTPMSHSRCDSH